MMFFFVSVTPTTEIYTLSLPDAFPISDRRRAGGPVAGTGVTARPGGRDPLASPAVHLDRRGTPVTVQPTNVRTARHRGAQPDRKSTRLNSSHANISYAVFCLKKKISES